MTDYYVIECYSEGRNSHTTDRAESWVVKKRQDPDPRTAVINYNRIHSDMVRLCDGKRDMYDTFCFGGNHDHLCRAFLCPPDLAKISELLAKDGVHVIM